jgi:hypothetical protein
LLRARSSSSSGRLDVEDAMQIASDAVDAADDLHVVQAALRAGWHLAEALQ